MEPVALQSQEGPDTLHAAGELIDGKYRLEREIGAGAMGRVWLARNAMLDLPVAIKIVDVQSHGRDAVTRVLAEARLLAQLSHPNIVRVLDCHSDENAAYVVMELLEGCTLAELMAEGPLPAALAVRLTVPLLDALANAHRSGIVHRDIKPENIFIARRANGNRVCPKLLDFGIAHSGELTPCRARKSKRLVVGTPGYMSPEQALGDETIDHRADIWAMGVVLYEAISGDSAFKSTGYAGYLRALRERKLAPLQCEGSTGLWTVLQRAMCHAREQRFASAAELAATLRLWLRARGHQEDLSSDSLPEHWVDAGGKLDRAWSRGAMRVHSGAASSKVSGQRACELHGSMTLVDPRNDTWPQTPLKTLMAKRSPRRLPLAAWAAVATAVCGTVALLHAHADAGDAARSTPVELDAAVIVAGEALDPGIARQSNEARATAAGAGAPRQASDDLVSSLPATLPSTTEAAPETTRATRVPAATTAPTPKRPTTAPTPKGPTTAPTPKGPTTPPTPSTTLNPQSSAARRVKAPRSASAEASLRAQADALGLKSPW